MEYVISLYYIFILPRWKYLRCKDRQLHFSVYCENHAEATGEELGNGTNQHLVWNVLGFTWLLMDNDIFLPVFAGLAWHKHKQRWESPQKKTEKSMAKRRELKKYTQNMTES